MSGNEKVLILEWLAARFFGEVPSPAFWIVVAALSVAILAWILKNPPPGSASERGRSVTLVVIFVALIFLCVQVVYPEASRSSAVIFSGLAFLLPAIAVGLGAFFWLDHDKSDDSPLLIRAFLFTASYFAAIYFASQSKGVITLSIVFGVLFGAVVGAFVHIRVANSRPHARGVTGGQVGNVLGLRNDAENNVDKEEEEDKWTSGKEF